MWEAEQQRSVHLPAIDQRHGVQPVASPSKVRARQYNEVPASRLLQMESRVEMAEKANRALLDETVRLQGELKAAQRHSEAQLQEERRERALLSENLRTNNTVIEKLRVALDRLEGHVDGDNKAVQTLLLHTQNFDKKILGAHQELQVTKTESESHVSRLQQEVESLRDNLRRMDAQQEKLLRAVNEDMRQIKSRSEIQHLEASETSSDVKSRIGKMETELRATVEVVMKLRQDHVTLAADNGASLMEVVSKVQGLEQAIQDTGERLERQRTAMTDTEEVANKKLEVVDERLTDQFTRVSGELVDFKLHQNQVQAKIDALKQEVTDRLAAVQELHNQRSAELEKRLKSDIAESFVDIQSVLKTERDARSSFEADARVAAEQRSKSSEAQVRTEMEALKTSLQKAQLDANTSLTKLNESISLLERSMQSNSANMEQVLQAEITSRQMSTQKVTTELHLLKDQLGAVRKGVDVKVKDALQRSTTAQDELKETVTKSLSAAREDGSRSITDIDTRVSLLMQRLSTIEQTHLRRIEELDHRVVLEKQQQEEARKGLEEKTNISHKRLASQIQEGVSESSTTKAEMISIKRDLLARLETMAELNTKEVGVVKQAVSRKVEQNEFEKYIKNLQDVLQRSQVALRETRGQVQENGTGLQSLEAVTQRKLASESSARNEDVMQLRQELARVQTRCSVLLQQHDDRLMNTTTLSSLQRSAPLDLGSLRRENSPQPPASGLHRSIPNEVHIQRSQTPKAQRSFRPEVSSPSPRPSPPTTPRRTPEPTQFRQMQAMKEQALSSPNSSRQQTAGSTRSGGEESANAPTPASSPLPSRGATPRSAATPRSRNTTPRRSRKTTPQPSPKSSRMATPQAQRTQTPDSLRSVTRTVTPVASMASSARSSRHDTPVSGAPAAASKATSNASSRQPTPRQTPTKANSSHHSSRAATPTFPRSVSDTKKVTEMKRQPVENPFANEHISDDEYSLA